MQSSGGGRFSFIIINYNYAQFLKDCIESVISEAEHEDEIIVVDDGSSDESRGIIENYAEKGIQAIYQKNGGMISAMNTGFSASSASKIIFLDADDCLAPGSRNKHASSLTTGVVRSQGFLEIIDGNGILQGRRMPGANPPSGDLLAISVSTGPGAVVSSPNSGNAWARYYLEQVFPLPAERIDIGAETFLMDSAGLCGLVSTTENVVAFYRLHGSGMSASAANLTAQTARRIVRGMEVRASHMAAIAANKGITVDPEQWLRGNSRIILLKKIASRFQPSEGISTSCASDARSILIGRGKLVKRIAALGLFAVISVLPISTTLSFVQKYVRTDYM